MPVYSVLIHVSFLLFEILFYLSVSLLGCKLLEGRDYVSFSVFMHIQCLTQRRHFTNICSCGSQNFFRCHVLTLKSTTCIEISIPILCLSHWKVGCLNISCHLTALDLSFLHTNIHTLSWLLSYVVELEFCLQHCSMPRRHSLHIHTAFIQKT